MKKEKKNNVLKSRNLGFTKTFIYRGTEIMLLVNREMKNEEGRKFPLSGIIENIV